MMEKSEKKYLVTAALPYANGPIHIGHLAGAYLPADIYTRYLRLKNENVLFVCGSDEHGAAITLRAKKEGKSPQEIVDQYHQLNKEAFERLGIGFDIFHRTTEQLHHQTAQDFFKELNAKGVFEKKTSEQFYDEEYKQFLADRYIMGTCPKCGNESAYGDQCENCGSALSPKDLINPISTLSNKKPIKKTTMHWYLPMQKHEDWLRDWIENGTLNNVKHHDPKHWRNQVIGQCKSWIDGGLQPRAMTRDLDWGVKVPDPEGKGKVLYVWLDAPIGYISATKEWAKQNAKNWETYWKEESTEMIHFIGKDNIVFHSIIFPIILKAHGGFNLPANVVANEFLNLQGKKISTSRNWAVWLHEYLEDFKEKEDVLRYVLTSIAPENKDSEFTWEDFQARNNNELVAIYGNFVNRVLVLIHKYYQGIVPKVDIDFSRYDDLINELKDSVNKCTINLDHKHFREALTNAMAIARLGNKFLADSEPWKLIKTEPAKVEEILYLALQLTANAAIALSPFLPDSSSKLMGLINLEDVSWKDLGRIDLIQGSTQIGQPEHLFQKVEDEIIENQIKKLKETSETSKAKEIELPRKPTIKFEDFVKLDLRIGKIEHVEEVDKSNKLLKLQIDLGSEKRTILSGIAKHYSVEELIGRQVQVLVNLAPRKIMGVESQGMVLMAEDSQGTLQLIRPDSEVENGSQVS